MLARAWILGFALLFSSALALAGPGSPEGSVQDDARALGGTFTSEQSLHYTRYEIAHHWSQIHEFTANGKVFALAWHGRRHPDLKLLLGSHYADFLSALAQSRRSHRRGGAIILDNADVHLEVGGHAMSVYGRTWIKGELPQGMGTDEVQ